MKKIICYLALSLTAFATVATAESVPSHIANKIDSFLNSIENDKKKLQGGAIAIIYQGKVVYKTTFGHQKGKSYPITASTLFPLASVSKPIAATVVAMMVEDGTLNLNTQWSLPCIKSKVSLRTYLVTQLDINLKAIDK